RSRGLLHPRVAPEVAGRGGVDVGVDRPPPQLSLARHARLLHHARRREILDVAHGPHAVDLGLRQRPVGDGADDFRHVAASPVLPAEYVAELHAMALRSDVDRADQAAVLAQEDDPRVWAVTGPASRAIAEEVARLDGAPLGWKAHVARGLGVTGVRR